MNARERFDHLEPTGEPDWANAKFKEEDGYTWNVDELGLARSPG